jgi:hypothetical protein
LRSSYFPIGTYLIRQIEAPVGSVTMQKRPTFGISIGERSPCRRDISTRAKAGIDIVNRDIAHPVRRDFAPFRFDRHHPADVVVAALEDRVLAAAAHIHVASCPAKQLAVERRRCGDVSGAQFVPTEAAVFHRVCHLAVSLLVGWFDPLYSDSTATAITSWSGSIGM